MILPIWSPPTGDINLTAALLQAILGGESGGGLANTNITTAGAGTLTAAAIAGGQITRTGPTAAFTDTTDTAAAIISALGINAESFVAGFSFVLTIRNAVKWPETLAAGTGVTISNGTVNPGFSAGSYLCVVGGTFASPTITMSQRSTVALYSPEARSNPVSTALTTNGAGTITAAGVAGGLTLRSVPTSGFTDTTDTADNIIAAAALSTDAIGASFLYKYVNNSVAPATIAGGTGVTVSGATVIPPNSWVEYLVTYTAGSTMTVVATAQGYFPKSGTFVANGATPVTVTDARVTASSAIEITLKTVGGTVSPTRPNVLTITPGTGFTVGGVASDTSTYNYTILG